MYQKGNREVIIATLDDLDIVVEEQLSLEQVMEFRADDQIRGKYKRLLHWLDKEMVGRSPNFVRDEVAIRLDDY